MTYPEIAFVPLYEGFLMIISDAVKKGNCPEPVLNSYASGDALHPESPDAASFTLSYALSSRCFGLS
jgi:hypothetical protein